ncbi:MAG: DUF2971 domain-containing protein [Bacteroidetes bacterium]|nr:DUF2971 domain-containing protein [Bacteroidota bacterium]
MTIRGYYFTPSIFAISNIALRRIKISRIQDLNDPFELLAANLSDISKRKLIIKIKDDLNSKTGIICFSESWKNPLLWGHYAEKHTGIALGFDINDEFLLPVKYKKDFINMNFDKLTGNPNRDDMFNLLRTKFYDWNYENEVRLFVELDESRIEAGLYFEPFTQRIQLKEVILGPRCELSIDSVRELVKSYNPKVSVIKSNIAFTQFEVLENKEATNLDKRFNK